MEYICLGVCLILFMLCLKRKDNLCNPVVLFFGLWSIILFFNVLGLYGINKAEDITYGYIMIGLLSIFAGSVLAHNTKAIHISFRGKSFEGGQYQLRYSFLFVLMGLTYLFLILDTVVVVRELFNGNSLGVIRTWYASTYSSGVNPIEARRGYAEQVLRVILIEPFLNALPMMCAINLFDERRNKKFFVSSIILLLLNIIASGGGRLSILNYALSFVMAFSIYRRNYFADAIQRQKQKNKIKVFIVIGVIGVVFLTLKRAASNVFEEIYYYFAMCIPLLDRWIPYIQSSPKTYGLLSLFGVLRIPFLVFEKIGWGSSELYMRAQSYILQANYFYNVGARSGNSFVSLFYYLYLDGGVFAIIIGMFFLGYMCIKVYKSALRSIDKKEIYILLLLIQGVFLSFMRWPFTGTASFMSFVYTPLFFAKVDSYKTDE